VDDLFVVLSTGDFESCVSPKTPKSGEFASPVRYFYFTLPDFLNVRKLFLIASIFLIFACIFFVNASWNKRVKSIFGIFRFRKEWYVCGGNLGSHCRYSISPLQRLLSI
jgi:hypothetical protein